MGLHIGQEPSEPHLGGLPMGLISAQPNRARLNLDCLKATPYPPAPQVSTRTLARQACHWRGRANSDKDLQQKSQTCPTLPASLCTPRHSPTESSLCTLKCLQSNQLRIQKEAPTGSDGWQAQLTATFWDAITHQQCIP